jgi:hypothetical protein
MVIITDASPSQSDLLAALSAAIFALNAAINVYATSYLLQSLRTSPGRSGELWSTCSFIPVQLYHKTFTAVCDHYCANSYHDGCFAWARNVWNSVHLYYDSYCWLKSDTCAV